MSNLIDRQAAIDVVKGIDSGFVKYIEALPSAQPEIIRCKNCKYSSPNGVYGCRLERYDFNDESVRMYGEDFCSHAERRTDDFSQHMNPPTT